MNISRAACLTWLLAPIVAFAHLGDSEQQLTARFGQPLSRGHDITLAQGKVVSFGSKLSFQQGDWTITCIEIDGRCARVFYTKTGEWVEDQLRAVLTSNAQGKRWTDNSKEMVKQLMRDWRRSDGAVAYWRMVDRTMVVTDPAYDRAVQDIQAKAKADASQIPNL
jgi:hypothetical protein